MCNVSSARDGIIIAFIFPMDNTLFFIVFETNKVGFIYEKMKIGVGERRVIRAETSIELRNTIKR